MRKKSQQRAFGLPPGSHSGSFAYLNRHLNAEGGETNPVISVPESNKTAQQLMRDALNMHPITWAAAEVDMPIEHYRKVAHQVLDLALDEMLGQLTVQTQNDLQ